MNNNNVTQDGIRVGYTVDGTDQVEIYVLANEAANRRWSADWRNIKHIIGNINERPVNERNNLYLRWLQIVDEFRRDWGSELLPSDIRKAVNSVEAGLKLPQTDWENVFY